MHGEDLGKGVQPSECDSDVLSGTSPEEERRERCGYRVSQTPSTVQGADLTVGQLLTIPDGLLHPGKVNMYSYSRQITW